MVEPQGMAILSQIAGSQNGKAEYVHRQAGKCGITSSALRLTLPLMSERMNDVAGALDPLRLPDRRRLINISGHRQNVYYRGAVSAVIARF